MNKYNLWEPIEEIPYADLYFFSLRNDLGKIILSLKVIGIEDKMLQIEFGDVKAYRVVQESSRLKSLNEDLSLRDFRTSINSDFINWFHEESFRQFADEELVHYAINNIDNIVDVISGLPVSVEWIPNLT